jgi:hypothetical protein
MVTNRCSSHPGYFAVTLFLTKRSIKLQFNYLQAGLKSDRLPLVWFAFGCVLA